MCAFVATDEALISRQLPLMPRTLNEARTSFVHRGALARGTREHHCVGTTQALRIKHNICSISVQILRHTHTNLLNTRS